MILILLILIFFLSVVLYLVKESWREQKAFEQKMHLLQERIDACHQKTLLQSHQIRLFDELEKTLKTNKITLSDAIFQLHYDLFDLLSKNNLLKPRK